MSPDPAPTHDLSCDAVLVAAGKGERLGETVPKARVPLCGTPLFLYSLRVLLSHPRVDQVLVVVLPDGAEERIMRAMIQHDLPEGLETSVRTVPGGERRQDSVRAGLEALHAEGRSPDGVVLIHDAARPLLSPELVSRCLDAMGRPAGRGGQAELPGFATSEAWGGCPAGVAPGLPVRETLKLVYDGRVILTQPREDLVAIQTPQLFRLGPILRAHRRAHDYDIRVSDDAALLEWQGIPLYLVPGESMNLKVTFPEDLQLAERILQGFHYDPPEGAGRVEL